MSDRPQDVRTAALLRRALDEHLEAVMTVTDTERELGRFRKGVRRRSRHGQTLAAAAAVVLAAAAIGGALALPEDGARRLFAGPSPSSVSGRLVLETQSSRSVELDRSDQNEYRDVLMVGTADLVADGRRGGTARLVGGGSTVQTGGGAVIVHAWGTADVTLDGQRCTGRFGYSYYYDPPEGGGSLNLSCEDGTVLGAGLVAQYGLSQTNPDQWTVELTLEDGFYLEG